jgi:hypothetical protein
MNMVTISQDYEMGKNIQYLIKLIKLREETN